MQASHGRARSGIALSPSSERTGPMRRVRGQDQRPVGLCCCFFPLPPHRALRLPLSDWGRQRPTANVHIAPIDAALLSGERVSLAGRPVLRHATLFKVGAAELRLVEHVPARSRGRGVICMCGARPSDSDQCCRVRWRYSH
jgi:hypothetical protein